MTSEGLCDTREMTAENFALPLHLQYIEMENSYFKLL